MEDKCSKLSKGKNVLAFCDTSAIHMKGKLGRITNFTGLGLIGRNDKKGAIGFFVHPILVEDEQDATPYGIANVKVYNRSMEWTYLDKSKRDVYRHIPIEEKETYKWIDPCEKARDEILKDAEHITFVMDSEGDIINVFERLPSDKTDVVIRNKHNRKIINESGKRIRLLDEIKKQKIAGCYEVLLHDPQKETNSKAIQVGVKFGKIQLLAPRGYELKEPITASYVEVKQLKANGLKAPLHWKILTSKEITNMEEALDIILIYKKRWRIEVFFKLLKSDGFNIEKTELETGKAIRKLTLMIMQASVKLLQLKGARNGKTELKVKDVFTNVEIDCLKKLNKELQGNTIKQQNPHSSEALSWAC